MTEIKVRNRRDEREAALRCATTQGSPHGSVQTPRDALVAGSSMQSTQQLSHLAHYAQQHRDDDPRMHLGPLDSPARCHIVFDNNQLNVPMPMSLPLPPPLQSLMVTVPPVHSFSHCGPNQWTRQRYRHSFGSSPTAAVSPIAHLSAAADHTTATGVITICLSRRH